MIEASLVADRIWSPNGMQGFDILFYALSSLFDRDIGGSELLLHPSLAETGDFSRSRSLFCLYAMNLQGFIRENLFTRCSIPRKGSTASCSLYVCLERSGIIYIEFMF